LLNFVNHMEDLIVLLQIVVSLSLLVEDLKRYTNSLLKEKENAW